MSIVIYSKGVMGGDRRTIVSAKEWSSNVQDLPKIHIHESRTFAIGVTGHLPGPRALRNIMTTIFDMMVKFSISDSLESMTLTPEIKAILFNESRDSIVMMTRHEAWLLENTNEQWVEITHVDYYMGNGGACAVVCLAAGLSVADSFHEISQVSLECGPTSDVVSMADLNEFTKEMVSNG